MSTESSQEDTKALGGAARKTLMSLAMLGGGLDQNPLGGWHDCPPEDAQRGDFACETCGMAWRWIAKDDPQCSYWEEITSAELISERDAARGVAVGLEQENALKDEALAEIAALRVALLKSERTVENDRGSISWELLGTANDIQRILSSVQSRLDPFRDDEEAAQ